MIVLDWIEHGQAQGPAPTRFVTRLNTCDRELPETEIQYWILQPNYEGSNDVSTFRASQNRCR